MNPALAAFLPLIEYFRPSKSPYLISVIFGIISLIIASGEYNKDPKWFSICIPFFLILPILTLLTYYSKLDHTGNKEEAKKDIEDQLKFSRTISVSVGMICLVISSKSLAYKSFLFYVNYLSCILHILIFVIYMSIRVKKEEEITNFNFFQFSFMTTSYLVAFSFCISNIDISDNLLLKNAIAGSNDKIMDTFSISSILFYILWLSSEIYWIKRISRIVEIRIIDSNDNDKSANNESELDLHKKSKKNNLPITKKAVCSDCGKPLINRKTKSGKGVLACSNYPNCKEIIPL